MILQMAKREIQARYRGSVLGMVWSFAHPLIMLGVYTFIFSGVFKARWGEAQSSKMEFAIILFCGLIVYNLFAECTNRSASLIVGNPIYVKKVVFPLEILPWVSMASALFHAAISMVALLLFYAALNFYLPWTVVFFPAVLVPLILFTMGICWFLSSLGVFIRDVHQIVGIITTIMLFLCPIFYPLSAVPDEFRVLMRLNPLSIVVEQAREVVLWGRLPDWTMLTASTAVSIVVAWLGLLWFQKTRKGFADVM